MGNKSEIPKLPKSIETKVLKLFSNIDTDGSKTIDKNETLKYWSKNFPKLNSLELFNQVDKNNDNSIQENEWVEFWARVLNSGHSEEEVEGELDNMLNGGSWVKFENVDDLNKNSNKKR